MTKKLFALLAALLLVLLAACGEGGNGTDTSAQEEDQAAVSDDCRPGEEIETDTGLKYTDEECGDGEEAVTGAVVSVHYVGRLENGKKFDSSRDRGQPFAFSLGAGQVIPGWDEGVAGMRVGGVRELVIPPELGYGASGAGGVIPPNATLIFQVELLEVSDPAASP
ncbi:MAG: FKBP-type peptidyl-prolyl cis-trans isomerase [Actinomycetota bacterium]